MFYTIFLSVMRSVSAYGFEVFLYSNSPKKMPKRKGFALNHSEAISCQTTLPLAVIRSLRAARPISKASFLSGTPALFMRFRRLTISTGVSRKIPCLGIPRVS